MFGEQIDELQIKAISVDEKGLSYLTNCGKSIRENEVFDTYDNAVDALIQEECRRHEGLLRYFTNLKERRK